MDTEKIDNRDLKQIELSYSKIKKSITLLLKSLDNEKDLKQEFKHSLIEYILEV